MHLTSPLDAAQNSLKEMRWEKAVSLYERHRRYAPDDWRGYGEACVAYWHLGQWEQADGVIEAGLAKLGEVKELLIAYGDTAMDQQRWEAALTRWERLRATHPDESRGWVRAAKALLEQDQLMEAQQLLAQGVAQLGEREELTQAQQAIEARVQAVGDALQEAKQQGRWEAALEQCERLRRYAPDDWRGYGEACVAYWHLGQWEQADGVIEAGLAKLGEVKELLIAYGDTAMDQQRWEAALTRWERLRATHPDESRGWVRAAKALLEQDQLMEAQQLLAQGVAQLGEREELTQAQQAIEARVQAVGDALQEAKQQGRWEAALEQCERLRRYAPDDWRGYGEACVAYWHLGQWEQADGVIEAGMAKLGEVKELLIAYGDAAMDQQRWEAALTRWERLRATHPDESRGWVRAAKALLEQDQLMEAQQLLAQGVAQLGEREELTQAQQAIEARVQAVGDALQEAKQQGRWEAALEQCERLRRYAPDDWRGYGEACVAYRHLGQWEQADGVIEAGLAKLGEVKELLIAYGDTAMDQQRWEAALTRWERLRATHPDESRGWVRAAKALLEQDQRMEAQQLLAQGVAQLGEREELTQAQQAIEAQVQAVCDALQEAKQQGRWEAALEQCERLRRYAPDDWRGYGEACVAYWHLGQWEQADGVIEAGLAKLGEVKELLIAYGDTAMDQQRWEAALTRWERLRATHPDESRGWVRAAKALLEQDQLMEAQQLLAQGVAQLGEREELTQAQQAIEARVQAVGDALQEAKQQGRWEAALEQCERLRRYAPDDWRGYGEACVAYWHLGQWEQADGVIEAGLAKLGEVKELLIAYGDTAMDQQRWEAALTRWERLRATHPDESRGWVRAAKALLEQDQLMEAQQLLAQGVAQLGEREELTQAQQAIEARVQAVGDALQEAKQQGRWEAALEQCERLRRYAPDDWRGYGEACVAYWHLGQWEQADGVIEAGMAKLGEVKELLIAYGDAAMDQQRWEAALTRWERLRATHPDESRGWVRAAKALLEQDQLMEAQQLLAQGVAQLGEREELTQAQQAIEARVQAVCDALQEAKQQGRWEAALEQCERLRRYAPDDWRGYGEACVAYWHLGQWEQADGVIEAGLAKLGEVKELLIAYGDTAMDQQRWEAALTRWERLRATHPDESRGWVRAAKALLEQDQLMEAQQLLAQGVAQLGEREELTQAQQAIEARVQAVGDALQEAKQQGRWEAALEQCERLRRYAPDDWRGYGEACVAYWHLGQWEQADGVIEAGMAKLGEVKELLIAYGDAAMDQQRWEAALTRWERLRATHPDESRGWVRAAKALLEQDQLMEAQQLLAQGVAQLGEREELTQAQQAIEARVQAVGDALQEAKQQGRWEAALEQCERLRRYAPDDWRGYGEACVAYRHLGQWEQADGVIEAGLAKLGEVKELLIAYGDTAMDQQRWEAALTRWERLRATHPDESRGWVRAAKALLEQDQRMEAQQLLAQGVAQLGEREELTQAQQAIEAQVQAVCDALQEAKQQGRWEAALEQCERLRRYAPDDWRGYGEACVAYRHLGQWEQADGVIEAGLAKLGEVKELLIAYGDTAMDQQRWETALTRWERMKRSHPEEQYPYKRAVEAANETGDELATVRAFASFKEQFGLPEPDPITWRLLEAMSSKIKKKRRICFVTHAGFSGHGKYLYLFLLKYKSHYGIDVCWITGSVDDYELLSASGLPVIYWDMSPKKADYLLQTDLAIYTTHEPISVDGGTHQACLSGAIKVQLWHGIPAKSVGYGEFLNWSEINEFARYAYDACGYDHAIIESENITATYRFAFPCSTLHPMGGCRTDVLLGSQLFEDREVWMGAKQLPSTATDKKLILYAPTYRERSQNAKPFIEALQELIERIEKQDEFVLAIKPHPAFVTETRLDLKRFAQRKKNTVFIDGLEDIYPWAACADYLVTDYSSIYYDFLITKKPIVFFRPDVDLYDVARTRVQYPFETALEPGPVITNATEITSAILDSESEKWQLNRATLAKKFHALPHDGMVTKRVADFVVSLLRV